MKVALLADIHGNMHALRVVIEAASNENVELYLIVGDFVGYYYQTAQILKQLEKIDYIAVRGNHEDLYRRWINEPNCRSEIKQKYGSSFCMCQNLDLDKIINLPKQKQLIVANKNVLLCHGSPWDHDEYLYPDAKPEIIERLFSYHADIVVFGHTHYPVVWKKVGNIVVNPGSVGQPRDYKPGACWALWNTDLHTVELRREQYDTSELISECKKYDPELEYLQDVLLRNNCT